MTPDQPFIRFDQHFGAGSNAPPVWRPVCDVNLLILVGLTGVGKSTTLDLMAKTNVEFHLAPNRRELTDKLIIEHLQRLGGEEVAPVRDRQERFEYTRRFRRTFPGGMAHAFGQVWVAPEVAQNLIIFDGLRGATEVEYAARRLPRARFVVLTAPDHVRVQRLLGRNDHFDQIRSNHDARPGELTRANDATSLYSRIPDLQSLNLSAGDEAFFLTRVNSGAIGEADLCAKLAIVREERRNYDPDQALSALQTVASERTFVVDTVADSPEESVQRITKWLQNDATHRRN